VDILITGGEGYNGLAAYRECVTRDTYDILQPDCRTVGGILTMCKVAAIAEAWRKPVCPHGIHSLVLAGRLQASAAFGAMYQEIAVLRASLLPEEVDAPALKVLNSKELYVYRDGAIEVPQGPGLGLDINEEALARYRVSAAKGS
jgi:L-alanine-DL-glutamate epimerase-like enolase superfamily enzyme